MSPFLQALALYEGCERTFYEDVAAFSQTGRVHITPTCVLLAKAVPSNRLGHLPWDRWEPAECDGWLIWLAAGDMREFFRYSPHPLPWLVWCRRQPNKIIVSDYEAVRRRVMRGAE